MSSKKKILPKIKGKKEELLDASPSPDLTALLSKLQKTNQRNSKRPKAKDTPSQSVMMEMSEMKEMIAS